MQKRDAAAGEMLHEGAQRLPLVTVTLDGREQNVSCSYYTVAVGDRVSSHYHKTKTEIWLVVSGAAIIRLGDELTEVRASTAIITPPGIVHAVTTVLGDEPLVFANFATPPNRDGPGGRYAGTIEVREISGE